MPKRTMSSRLYQLENRRTRWSFATAERQFLLGVLGLTGEAGEIANLVEKHFFHEHPWDREKMIEELGDCLWYFTLLCDATDVTLEEVMAANVAKLRQRYPHGWTPEDSLTRVDHNHQGSGSLIAR